MRSLALCGLWQLLNSTDILEKQRMLKTSRIETVPMVRKRLPYINFGTWGIESAAWVNEVWAVNEFPEARDKGEEFHTEIDSPEKEALHPFREERIDDYCGLKQNRIS